MVREDIIFKKLRVIELFRFGLVLEYYIDQFIIGFDQIKDVIEKILRKCEVFLFVGF